MGACSSSTSIASSSSSLPPSSSLPLGSLKYDVFLSFRGVETRQGFTWNLYHSLQNAGIETFMDEKNIEAGEEINESLLKAIGDSKYCVVILSSQYADSKACLMELAAMFQLKKEIIPVFFYVEPSDVRHQSGPFKIAFSTHQKHSNSSRYVKQWRQAMTKVGQLNGFHLNHRSSKKEAEWIQEIVKRVGGRNDNIMLHVAEYTVGIDSRVEEVMELLSIEEQSVKMVGIYGMGGVGKTTLAKEIYNRLQDRFQKAIILEDIKDKAKTKDGLCQLQQQFISKAFEKIEIYGINEGILEIKKRFPRKRVLAVLDDVDDADQLKALAGGCDWFGEGTRILITTRDVQLLNAHRVHEKYQVLELNGIESLHLFSRHAFQNDQPNEEFMEISKKVVNAAGGLPLALEVLGASLSTETEKEAWEEVETKLRSSEYSKIDKCLRISYDGLSQKEQEGFLDIACFFIGEDKDEVIDIWKGYVDTPVSTFNSLLHKSLLKVRDDGRLYMHDLLRDMGRVIGSRSRLWDQKKVWEVLGEYKGTNEIKGIICKSFDAVHSIVRPEEERESFDVVHSIVRPEEERESVDVASFANMSNLELLLLEGINLKGDFSKMPSSLRSLKWIGCSMQTLPDNFNIQKLGCLKLHNSNIVQFWGDSCIKNEKVFTNLKVLDLRDCSAITKLPDFYHSLDLEKLYLGRCSSLTDLPESIGNSTKLKMIDLTYCCHLHSLPSSVGTLSKLEHLGLGLCSSLSRLPDSFENLTELRMLNVSHCTSLLESFSTLPHFIENLTRLRSLDVSGCEHLSALPHSIENLSQLQELQLNFCKSLSTLPNSIGKLTQLKILTLDSCESLLALPSSIENLTELEVLVLSKCTSLLTLPDSVGMLTKLRMLHPIGCQSLLALPDSIGNLTGLRWLHLTYCESLSALPYSIGSLTLIEELRLFLCKSLSTLPDSIGNLTRLRRLDLTYCESLSTLPYSIGRLSLLEDLLLYSCTSLSTLPDSIGNLTGLRDLTADCCTSLLALPDSIGNLTRLEELRLSSCRSLSALPSSIGSLRRLSTLVVSGSGIEELPDSVRLLESLEWLGVVNLRLRSRPPLFDMKNVKSLIIRSEDFDIHNADERLLWGCEILDGIAHVGGEVNKKDESDSNDGNPNGSMSNPR